MRNGVIELNRRAVGPAVAGLVVLGALATTFLVMSVRDDVEGPIRVVVRILGGIAALLALAMVFALAGLRRPRRLVIDHEGIRLDNGRSRPAFRVAWTELAGVGLLVNDARRRRNTRYHRRFHELPPSTTPVAVVLELVPADDEAVRRHPELRQAWRLGRSRSWRVALGPYFADPPPVADLVQRWRPGLWRGERSGSLFTV